MLFLIGECDEEDAVANVGADTSVLSVFLGGTRDGSGTVGGCDPSGVVVFIRVRRDEGLSTKYKDLSRISIRTNIKKGCSISMSTSVFAEILRRGIFFLL